MKLRFQSDNLLDKKTFSPKQLAKMHNVSLETLMQELKIGISEEMKEHTTHSKVAEEIALDHLKEDPKYYTNMKKQGRK